MSCAYISDLKIIRHIRTHAAPCSATFCDNADGSGTCCTLGAGRYGNCDKCASHPNKILTTAPCPANDRISFVRIQGAAQCGAWVHEHTPTSGGRHDLLRGPGVYTPAKGSFKDNTLSDATVGCIVDGKVKEYNCGPGTFCCVHSTCWLLRFESCPLGA